MPALMNRLPFLLGLAATLLALVPVCAEPDVAEPLATQPSDPPLSASQSIEASLDGRVVRLALRRAVSAVPPARVLVDGGAGAVEFVVEDGWRLAGFVEGEAGSSAVGVHRGGCWLVEVTSRGERWLVRMDRETGPGATDRPLVGERAGRPGAMADELVCEAIPTGVRLMGAGRLSAPDGSALVRGPVAREIELSVDADWSFVDPLGGVDAALLRIEQIVALASTMYERDIGARLVLRTVVIRASRESDPYAQVSGHVPIELVRDIWNSDLAGERGDVVMHFTGRPLVRGLVGLAWLDAACSDLRYGQCRMNVFGSDQTLQAVLLAHEVGHSFGADHCNDPASAEYAPGDCRIMCSVLGGCSGVDPAGFGSVSAERVRQGVVSRPCTRGDTPPARGLVVHHDFDLPGTVVDNRGTTGSANDATVLYSGWRAAGLLEGGIGLRPGATVLGGESPAEGDLARTFSGWLRPEGGSAGGRVVGLLAGPGLSWIIAVDGSGRLELSNGSALIARTDVPLPLDVWSHVAVAADPRAAAVRVLFDGRPVSLRVSDAVSGALGAGAELVYGAALEESGLPGDSFLGSLDDAALWNEAISDDQIGAMHVVAVHPLLGYDASAFEQLRRVHLGELPEARIGTLSWTRRSLTSVGPDNEDPATPAGPGSKATRIDILMDRDSGDAVSAVVSAGLLVHLDLNEVVGVARNRGATAGANDGRPRGPSARASGLLGGAFRLADGTSWIQAGATPVAESGAATLSAWFRLDRGGRRTLASMGSGGTGFLDVRVDASSGTIGLSSGAGSRSTAPKLIVPGRWHHLAIVIPAGRGAFQDVLVALDGVVRPTSGAAGSFGAGPGGVMQLGRSVVEEAAGEIGPIAIDDVSVWMRGFGRNEIDALRDAALDPELGHDASGFDALAMVHLGLRGPMVLRGLLWERQEGLVVASGLERFRTDLVLRMGEMERTGVVAQGPACSDADFAEPYGSLDLDDIIAFFALYEAEDAQADLVADEELTISDIIRFVALFTARCG